MKSTKDNTHSAIIKLNTALEDVLKVDLGTDVIIRFDLPKLDSPVESPTVSVFLYQLTEDLELRDISDRKLRKVLRDLDAQVEAIGD